MTVPYLGRCYTIGTASRIGSLTGDNKNLFGFLTKSQHYYFAVHDPNFFYISENPTAVPSVSKTIKNQTLMRYQMIKVIKHVKRNTKNYPCNENKDFKFSLCIRKAVEQFVGCRMPWNGNRNKSIRCYQLSQYKQYGKMYRKIANMDFGSVRNLTNCRPPCRYMEVLLVGDSHRWAKSGPGYVFTLATTDIRVETEVQLYSVGSLVAELGGSLGLFLGFSFFMLWDLACQGITFLMYEYK